MAPHWLVAIRKNVVTMSALVSDNHQARVSVNSVSKRYAEKDALSGIDLEIEPGSFVVLLGPSGSGKTTLLRCLAGIERPTSGSISIDGTVVASAETFVAPEHRNLSMVFQDYALWPHMNVAKNVGFALRRVGIDRTAVDRKVATMLEKVGLTSLAARYPNELSGGEQQRVALARALVANVGLILFDEPLSNLDADRRELLRIEIATLARESGSTCVYITHDQSEAFALADTIGVLNQGKLVQLGTPESIYQRPASSFVARFTGIAGEIPASVLTVDDRGFAELRLHNLETMAPLLARNPQGLKPGDAATVFIRAAGVSLDGEGAVVDGQVQDVAYNGRGYEHVVALRDGTTLTKISSTRRRNRTSAVSISVDPEFLIALPNEEKS
jgi:iron(III) transport system ATP-binding protein